MTERFSSIERVFGKNLSEDDKVQILQSTDERFNNQEFNDSREKEKTEREIIIINFVNDKTNKLREKYGLDEFNIPIQNIHIIEKEKWPKKGSSGVYIPYHQAVAIRETKSNLVLAKKIYHEMVHFKSYGALHTIEETQDVHEYRTGWVTHQRSDGKEYFRNINEAVTEELTMRFIKSLDDNPLFINEVEQTEKLRVNYPNAKTPNNSPLFDENTFYAEITGIEGNVVYKSVEDFTYKNERVVLNAVIDKLYNHNSEEFKKREDIFEIFAKAMITGNILTIGKLIEKTFGTGTLRKLANDNIEEQMKLVDTF